MTTYSMGLSTPLHHPSQPLMFGGQGQASVKVEPVVSRLRHAEAAMFEIGVKNIKTENLTEILGSRLGESKGTDYNLHFKYEEDNNIDSDYDTPLHILLARCSGEGDLKDFDENTAINILKTHEIRYLPYVNNHDKHQQTPLHIAVFFQSISLVKVLLSMGADWCRFDCRLETPLHAAILFANENWGIQRLANQNQSDDLPSKQDESYLSFPSDVVEPTIETYLQQDIPNILSTNQNSSFTTNQKSDKMFKIIELLLNSTNGKTEYVNALNEKGNSALHMALSKGRCDIVTILMKHGASPNIQESRSGFTPLMCLIKKMIYTKQELIKVQLTSTIIDFIQEFEPDVNKTSYSKDTALHFACLGNSLKIVKTLLDAGAEINERNTNRKSEKDLTSSPKIKALLDKHLRKKRRQMKTANEHKLKQESK